MVNAIFPYLFTLLGIWFSNVTFTIFATYLLPSFKFLRHICNGHLCANPFFCRVSYLTTSREHSELDGYTLHVYHFLILTTKDKSHILNVSIQLAGLLPTQNDNERYNFRNRSMFSILRVKTKRFRNSFIMR